MNTMGFEISGMHEATLNKNLSLDADDGNISIVQKEIPAARSTDRLAHARVPYFGSFSPPFEWVDPSSSGSRVTSLLPFGCMVESSGCSTEAESSEDDDFVAGLAERMAHSMLEDSEDEDEKRDCVGIESGSMDGVKCWRSLTSEKPEQTEANWYAGTPTIRSAPLFIGSLSPESHSTPVIPFSRESRSWDVMSSAVRDISALRKEEMLSTGALQQFGDQKHQPHEVPKRMNSLRELSWQCPPSSTSVQLPLLQSFPDHSLFGQNNSSVSSSPPMYFRDQITEKVAFHRAQHQRDLDEECKFSTNLPLKQGTHTIWARQSIRSHPNHHNSTGNSKTSHGKGGLPHRSMNAASHMHLMHLNAGGSGMRAVFLGGSGARKESSGTGVFLPRSSNYQKRKPVCSTVLLPSRILQVLNLQVNDLGCQPLGQIRSPSSDPILQSGSNSQGTRAHHNLKPSADRAILSHEQWRTFTTCSQLHQPSLESRLPSDWTY
ncbi:hypothetical protein O6H91_08G090200 [Diphasiastrum complanatum]|uniref:Uncharacterized protein n=2 Tax=Diphasiastrum complanatum TaxID=34168 RepID=A0ACC2CZW2_DIPCM|nr:hypothetical protein O6H91_08G030100 [Diphasiastrum complanatum]KAJ7547537.1 hypothetical protein O6H91_08G090200 [Diphasiastrum complanatum]